jgi:hypothetical protein
LTPIIYSIYIPIFKIGGSVQAPPLLRPLPPIEAFYIAVLGALTGYILLYRETRIAEFSKNPKQNWKVLVFDLVLYLMCGGLVTTYLIVPYGHKDAFTGGLAWQAVAGGVVAGTELATYRKAAEKEGDKS